MANVLLMFLFSFLHVCIIPFNCSSVQFQQFLQPSWRHLQSAQPTVVEVIDNDLFVSSTADDEFPPPPLTLPPILPLLPTPPLDNMNSVVAVVVSEGGSAALAEAVASSSCAAHYPIVVVAGDIDHADNIGSLGLNFTAAGAIDEGGRRVVRAVEGWRSSPDIMDNLESLYVDMYKMVFADEQQQNEQQQNEQQLDQLDDGLLSSNGVSYIKSLLVYLVPTFVAIAMLLLVLPLSACTCCSTKCRSCVSCSCCLLWCCGARRHAARPFPVCNRIVGSVGVLLLTIGITAVALLAVFWTDKLHSGLSKTQCVLSSLVSDAVNGSEGDEKKEGFVGLLPALQIMSEVSEQLDPAAVEGVMARLEDIVETALNVTNYKDQLIDSLGDLTEVLDADTNNPDRSADGTHHMFVFNAFVSDLLMLPKFNAEISEVRKNTL
eukprot:GHVS01070384.1.p2 GENE.GHVS01070384.1~~GHVS01070384.1.p2  ORF type:complete len:434 (-),score=82.64 GHVS01070384.1:2221-3522(-)